VVVLTCAVAPATGELRQEDHKFVASLGTLGMRPCMKSKTISKRTRSIVQVTESLPSKLKDLTSIPNTTKNKNRQKVLRNLMVGGARHGCSWVFDDDTRNSSPNLPHVCFLPSVLLSFR
jgi:hypothetical protein